MKKYLIALVLALNLILSIAILTVTPLTVASSALAIAVLIFFSAALIEGFIYCIPDADVNPAPPHNTVTPN